MISEDDLVDEVSLDQLRWARFDKTHDFRFGWAQKLTMPTFDKTWDEIRCFSALWKRVVVPQVWS